MLQINSLLSEITGKRFHSDEYYSIAANYIDAEVQQYNKQCILLSCS